MARELDFPNIDSCEQEAIHIPGSIQEYGYLFAVNPQTGEVYVYSENSKDLFCENSFKDNNRNFYELLADRESGSSDMQEVYAQAQVENIRLPVELKFKAEVISDSKSLEYNAILYSVDNMLVIEFEPALTMKAKIAVKQLSKLYSSKVLKLFNSMKLVDEIAQVMSETIRNLTGYDRVLVYRFNDDHSGKVISESKADHMDSYLGLYCPADDIPQQARELYLKSWVRMIPDVDMPSTHLKWCGAKKDSGRSLDLTLSLLRSISPFHLQYMRNQGLKASMSISLVTNNRLWGLISCHHESDYYLPQDIRLELENFSQLFSWQLYSKEEQIAHEVKSKADNVINKMIGKISDEKNIVSIFEENKEEILGLMDSSGFLFSYGRDSVILGRVPNSDVCKEIFESISQEISSTKPFASYSLSELLDTDADLNGTAGVLVKPLLTENKYYTAWFRDELVWERRWAGNPEEKDPIGDKRKRLMPRKSFELHVEKVRGESKYWSEEDFRVADAFNKIFLQHALRSQIALEKNINILQEQDRYKNEFIATLAHELRNPLSPITVAAEILELDIPRETRDETIATIRRQINQLTTLVDDLMDVSRISRGRIKMETKQHDISKIIQNAVEMCQQIITAKQHRLDVEIPESSIFVQGDFVRLSQVFANVLNNAAKYTDSKGQIKIKAYKDQTEVRIDVEDNGIGIPSNQLERVFDMFTQVDAFSTKTKGGLGIGLTLVRQLVKLHDGSVRVKSPGLGEGSTVSIVLPLDEGERKGARAQNISTGSKKTGSEKRVLVVDDNFDAVSMLLMLLESKGYTVDVAYDGQSALDLFRKNSFEYVFLDIGLPDIDGFEVCRRMREQSLSKKTMIIAQTGWGQQEHVDQSKAAGFDIHMTKPVQPKLLQQILSKQAPEDFLLRHEKF